MVKYSINVNLHLHLLVLYVTNAEISVQPEQKVQEKLKGILASVCKV